jgi:hypothetical protein
MKTSKVYSFILLLLVEGNISVTATIDLDPLILKTKENNKNYPSNLLGAGGVFIGSFVGSRVLLYALTKLDKKNSLSKRAENEKNKTINKKRNRFSKICETIKNNPNKASFAIAMAVTIPYLLFKRENIFKEITNFWSKKQPVSPISPISIVNLSPPVLNNQWSLIPMKCYAVITDCTQGRAIALKEMSFSYNTQDGIAEGYPRLIKDEQGNTWSFQKIILKYNDLNINPTGNPAILYTCGLGDSRMLYVKLKTSTLGTGMLTIDIRS